MTKHAKVWTVPTTDTPYGQTYFRNEADGTETYMATINLKAMGKPTMTYRSKAYKPSAVKYLREFCPQILAGFNRAGKFLSATEIVLDVQFATDDKSLWNKPHDKKPDMTNILKGIEDALLIEDSTVAWQKCSKFWGPVDKIEIELKGVARD